MVTVKAKIRYLDTELDKVQEPGDEHEVTEERAAVLEQSGVACRMRTPVKKKEKEA